AARPDSGKCLISVGSGGAVPKHFPQSYPQAAPPARPLWLTHCSHAVAGTGFSWGFAAPGFAAGFVPAGFGKPGAPPTIANPLPIESRRERRLARADPWSARNPAC